MKRWLTISNSRINRGEHATQPIIGITGVRGISFAWTGPTHALCKIIRDQGPLDAVRNLSGVANHGDEEPAIDATGRTVYRIPANLRAALVSEATRLGAGADWRPEGYDVVG